MLLNETSVGHVSFLATCFHAGGAQTWMGVPIVLVKSWGQTEGSSSSPGSQAFPLFSTDEALGN